MTVKNVIQIKFEMTRNANVSLKIKEKLSLKKVIFGILLYMVDMKKVLLKIQWLQHNMTKFILTKTIPGNFNTKKDYLQIICISLAFLLITSTLLIFVSIYFFRKYWAKQKHLLPFHSTNTKLKSSDIE